ncbi:MAG: M55 family metallopeptidase [Bacillota bacterium]
MEELKIYLEVDMEGITNISTLKQVTPGTPQWFEARKYMTMDTNAAVKGIIRAAEQLGKKAVIDVVDSHWKEDNILTYELDQRVNRLLAGTENRRYPQVPNIDRSYDALLCLGNHDQWKGQGILSHTWLFWEWTVNGVAVSETDLNGLTAGEHNVPLILVAGDNVITSKTKERWQKHGSDVRTVVTKEATGWESGYLYPWERTQKEIEEGAYEAVMGMQKGIYKPIVCPGPVVITIELDTGDHVYQVLRDIEGSEYAGGTTVRFSGETFEEAVAKGAQILDMFYRPTLDECDNNW